MLLSIPVEFNYWGFVLVKKILNGILMPVSIGAFLRDKFVIAT